jgi:hypothetical protein
VRRAEGWGRVADFGSHDLPLNPGLQINTIAAEIGGIGQKLTAIAVLAPGFAKRERRLTVRAPLAVRRTCSFRFTERTVVARVGQNYRITRNTTSRIRVTTTDTAMEPAIPRRLEKNTNMAT